MVAHKRIIAVLFALVLGVGAAGIVTAADVEVYQTANPTNPNVLYVLDNSGSMKNTDGTDDSRLKRYKDAIIEVLNDPTHKNINVGLAVYDENTKHYLRIPVYDLDSPSLQGDDEDRTHRDELITAIEEIESGGGTPTAQALHESALYFAGGEPRRIKKNEVYSGILDPDEKYLSPTAQCDGKNYIILMTDGIPNSRSSDDDQALAEFLDIPNFKDCKNYHPDFKATRCLPDLVDQLKAGEVTDSPVYMFTVGFGLEKDDVEQDSWLKDMADRGRAEHIDPQGNYVSIPAGSASTVLRDALQVIFEKIGGGESSKVATQAVPVSNFRRTAHANDLYYGVFAAENGDYWPGNVHKFKLGADAVIKDAKGENAVNDATGFFKTDAQSYWSDSADGGSPEEGGAKENLPSPNNRNIYTYISEKAKKDLTDNINSFSIGNVYSDSNTDGALKVEQFGIGITTSEQVEDVVNWVRNRDTQDKGLLMDPLHASVHVVTYESQNDGQQNADGITPENHDQYVIYGDNGGFLRALDAETGVEVWSFIPEELLSNLNTIRTNRIGTRTVYGVDGPISIWKDTVADVEKVYVYFTLRRGGRHVYALDITNIKEPKFVWSISSSDEGFEKLGQTWSRAVLTQIWPESGTEQKPVLMFGAGYDPDNDNETEREPDDIGNALYMIDSRTGSRIWAANSVKYPDMEYSIPGNLQLIDLDSDRLGAADRFYFGDTGGQLWRCMIKDSVQEMADPVNHCRVILDVSGNDSEKDDRRFFETPDVSYVTLANGKRKISIAIGSGDRANLTGKTVQDGFYVVHDGWGDDLINKTLTPTDLFDATKTLYAGLSDTDKKAIDDEYTKGWRIDLNTGEKVVSSPVTFAGVTYFTTYEHFSDDDNVAGCRAGTGDSRLYSVTKADGMPVPKFQVPDGAPTLEDRFEDLQVGTIPASPSIFRVADENGVLAAKGAQLCVGLECQALEGERTITTGHFDNLYQ